MANINKIKLSGTTYDIQDSNAARSVTLTQAEYDALVTGGTVDPNVFYIITDAETVDLTQYWTSAQTQSAITSATSGKVDTSTYNTYTAATDTALNGKQATLVSGTNIKTINNESLLGSGNIDIQGGGGKAIVAGRGITVTTGATADTVSFNLPISAGTGVNSIKEGYSTTASGNYGSHAEGLGTIASGDSSHAEGISTIAYNRAEHASGQYNVSNTGSTDADKTLFSVGNGIASNARHNAFEIRQNGDIYLTSGSTDIKLQDHLGGSGGGIPESAFTAYTAATDSRIAEDEEVTAAGLNALNESLSGKQDTLIAGDNITINGNVISAEGGSTYTAGRGIDINASNVVSVSLPLSAGSGTYSVAEGRYTYAEGNYSHSEGNTTYAIGNYSHSEGNYSSAEGNYSHAEGYSTYAQGIGSHTEGNGTQAKNLAEHASGAFNISRTGATEADRTLFTVGNGTAASAKHNAFEIRENGDIYLSLNGQDVKLQDQLGGGEVSSAITSGDTNAVAGGAVYDKFDEVEQVTAAGLNALNESLNDINDRLSEDEEVTAAALNVLDDKIDAVSGDVITISGAIPTTTSAVTSGSTAALTSGGAYTQFDGMKLKKLTQAQYEALAPNYDASTLYIIVN